MIAEYLGYFEMDLNILGCKYLFEISLPLDVFDCCNELVVIIDCVHVKVKYQIIDLLALLTTAYSNASIEG